MNKIEKIKNYAQTEFSKAKFLESWFFIKSEFKEIIFYPNFKKHFVFIYLIYLLGYSALLRANIDFLDDTWRSFTGYAKWENFSRYLSNVLSHFLHMGWNLLDQSPLNQLIAIGVVSLSSIFLTRIFFKKEEINYWHLLASLPIGLSPFFLSNIAFKFDSPYMALSVLASIFPFLFLKHNLSFRIVGILSLLITLTTYQAGHQVFIEISIFLILKNSLENKTRQELKELVFNCCLVFFIALIIFKLFIYNNNRVTSLVMPHELPIIGYNNLKRYFVEEIYKSFEGTFFLKLLIASFILATITTIIKYKKFQNIVLFLLFLMFAAVSSLGLFIFLEHSYLLARVRNYNGFAMFWVGILFLLLNNIKYISIINKCLIFFFCFNLLVIANIFGNALQIQNDYNNYRVVSVINTLNTDITNNNIKSSLIKDGRMLIKFPDEGMIAPKLHNNLKFLPLLKKLYGLKFAGGNWFVSISKYSTLDTSNIGNKFLGMSLKFYSKSYNCSFVHFSNQNVSVIKVSDTLLHKITYYSNNCIEVELK